MNSRHRNGQAAFTLTEVLVALGLASLVLGVVLQSAVRDTLSVSRAPARYQALLRASQVLEYRMEEDRTSDDATGSAGEKFPYDLATKPVVTDPRVEQVEVAVSAGLGRRETVSAYRLKVRRQGGKDSEDASATPTPEAPASPPAPAAPAAPPAAPPVAPSGAQ
jgi:type II secretory pathway pseudopilin PulG